MKLILLVAIVVVRGGAAATLASDASGAAGRSRLLERRAQLQEELDALERKIATSRGGAHAAHRPPACLTVGPSTGNSTKACWDSVSWALASGVYEHPEWYPGLSGSSSSADFQAQMAQRGQSGCPMPCVESCLTLGPDSGNASVACWEAIQWAKGTGIRDHPEWYAGLNASSSDTDIQSLMAKNKQNGCPTPCDDGASDRIACVESIKKTLQVKCWEAVQWASSSGIREHPDWYEGLGTSSTYVDFLNGFAKRSENECQVPACKCQTVGPNVSGKCWDAVTWAAFIGINEHPEWFPGLTKMSNYADFQASFAKDGQNECPWPCASMTLPKINDLRPWEKDTLTCESSLHFDNIASLDRKGLALDDTTFEHCSDEIPRLWPNTHQNVTSMRLFKASGKTRAKTMKTWDNLKALSQATGMRYLLGVPVTCNESDDELEWQTALDFVRHVGKESIMGLAIGNEIDLLYSKPGNVKTPQCIERLWSHEGYLNTFVKRVNLWDEFTGSDDLPVTAVFATLLDGADENPGKPDVLPFLRGAMVKFGSRFVFTINLYPYFSRGLAAAGCHQAAVVGTKFSTDEPIGFMPSYIQAIRQRMNEMGAFGNKLWVGETGWAAPRAGYCALGCYEACASLDTFETYYKNFLQWDLSAGVGAKADHVFYFTIRDSAQFGAAESFGLMAKCGDRKCKLG